MIIPKFKDFLNEENKLVLSSGNEKSFIKMINDYFYSTSIKVDMQNGTLENSKGIMKDFIAKIEKGRYKLYMIFK